MPAIPDSGFDRVASFYDPLASLVYGSSLQDAQRWLLPYIPDGAAILIIGGGSGWILEEIVRHCSPGRILYLEASENMLLKARQRNLGQTKVEYRYGNETALQPHEQFDVILTPFILDLFPEARLNQLMQRLNAALVAGGLWLFTDFWPAQQKPKRWQKLLAKSMYLFFGFLSNVQAKQLPDYENQFKKLPLQEQQSAAFFKGFVQAKVYRKL